MIDRFRIIILPEALGDLARIYAHISEDSPDNAAGMIERILDSIELLKIFPQRHSIESRGRQIANARRTLPVWPYVIFFRVIEAEKRVLILTIRHGARRRPKRLT